MHRGSLDAGDWIALNNRVQPGQHGQGDHVPVRPAAAAGRPSARRGRRSRSTRTPSTGRSLRRSTLDATGGDTQHLREPDVPAHLHGLARLFLVFRAVTGGPDHRPRQPQLGRVQRPGGHAARRGRRVRGVPSTGEGGAKHMSNASSAAGSSSARPRRRGRRDGARRLGAAARSAAGGRKGERLVPPDKLGVQQFSIRDSITRRSIANSKANGLTPTMGYLGGPNFPDDPTDLGPLVPLPGGFAEVFEYLASVGYRGFEFFQFTQNVNELGRQPTIAEIRVVPRRRRPRRLRHPHRRPRRRCTAPRPTASANGQPDRQRPHPRATR